VGHIAAAAHAADSQARCDVLNDLSPSRPSIRRQGDYTVAAGTPRRGSQRVRASARRTGRTPASLAGSTRDRRTRGGKVCPLGGRGQMVLETIVEEGLSAPLESIAVTTK
jgi:hypothetical protein